MAERDGRGRFQKGNQVARGTRGGSPKDLVEKAYFEAFKEAISLDDWMKATKAILKKAIRGNVQAYKLLATYGMRLPAQRIEQDINMAGVAMTMEEWQAQANARIAEVEEDINVIDDGNA